MNNTAAFGRRRTLYIKDPASAITHFIGAVGSAGASVPLLIKAAQTGRPLAFFAMAVYSLSLIALYAASTAYHTGRDLGLHPAGGGADAVLCVLPQVGVGGAVYRHGLGLHLCPAAAAALPLGPLLRLAAGRWAVLYGGRRHLRLEAPRL